VSYLSIHLFSDVLHRRHRVSPRRPMYLLMVGSHYCVMCLAYALHMCQQNLVPFPCLYIEFFELVIEVIFHYCTRPPCHKMNLFKRPFRGCCLERSMMLLWCSLASSSFTLRKTSFLLDDCLNSRMYSVCHSVGTSTWISSRSMMSTSPRCSGRATNKSRTMDATQYQLSSSVLG